MKRAPLGLLVLGSMVFTGPAVGAVEPELLSLPDADRAAIYRANAGAVDELRSIITDTKRPAFEREAALRKLRSRFREAALNTSLALVNDPSDEVSLAAASLLAASIVMTDHGHDHGQPATPLETYVNEKHAAARAALLRLLDGPNRPARDEAARILTSLSDEAALQIIRDGTKKGAYSETQAINYFGLANPDVAAAYILPHLDSAVPAVQSAASGYLATYPAYQSLVKERVFINSAASPLARATAARALSQYDAAYTSYAPAVARDQNAPEVVVQSVIEGVVRNVQIKLQTNKLLPGERDSAVNFVADFAAKNPKYGIYRDQMDLK